MKTPFVIPWGMIVLLLLFCCERTPVTPVLDPSPPRDLDPFADGRLSVPAGIQPEALTVGDSTSFFVGSLTDGSVYRGDFRSGTFDLLYQPRFSRAQAAGMAYDPVTKNLFVAGGNTGNGSVIDTETGEVLAEFAFGGIFISDVVITPRAAFYIDSFAPIVYRVDLPLPSGEPTASITPIALGDGFDFRAGQVNANGIEAIPNGKALLIVNAFTGGLYRIDAATGTSDRIDLGNLLLFSGDGLLRRGKTLYVTVPADNRVLALRLAVDFGSAAQFRTFGSPYLQFPTAVAHFGASLYAVNARYDVVPPGADPTGFSFDIVRTY